MYIHGQAIETKSAKERTAKDKKTREKKRGQDAKEGHMEKEEKGDAGGEEGWGEYWRTREPFKRHWLLCGE